MEKYLISEAFNKLRLTEAATLKNKIKLAENPNTPSDILSELADDLDYIVREWVAINPNTPPDILAKLANDKDDDVRERVADNPSIPSTALKKLANDENPYVRLTVAKNPNTSQDALSKLANDKDENVRKIAKGRIPYEANENEFGYTDDNFDDY